MRAGRRRHLVRFERKRETLDGYGEDVGLYECIAEAWAEVQPLSGREFFASQQAQSEISLRVICRYSPELACVTTKDRISHGSAYYDIRAIINVNSADEELQFMCTHHSIT